MQEALGVSEELRLLTIQRGYLKHVLATGASTDSDEYDTFLVRIAAHSALCTPFMSNSILQDNLMPNDRTAYNRMVDDEEDDIDDQSSLAHTLYDYIVGYASDLSTCRGSMRRSLRARSSQTQGCLHWRRFTNACKRALMGPHFVW